MKTPTIVMPAPVRSKTSRILSSRATKKAPAKAASKPICKVQKMGDSKLILSQNAPGSSTKEHSENSNQNGLKLAPELHKDVRQLCRAHKFAPSIVRFEKPFASLIQKMRSAKRVKSAKKSPPRLMVSIPLGVPRNNERSLS